MKIKMKIDRPLAFAISAGVLSFLLGWGLLRVRELRLKSLSESVKVVVAHQNILQGKKIEPSMLVIEKIPRQFIQPGAIFKLEQTTGMVSAAPILKGEQIIETKLIPLGPVSGIAAQIQQGMRALSVEIDEISGISGLIRADNFVDILATFEMEDANDMLQTATHTLIQKVLVLAVDTDFGLAKKSEAVFSKRAKTITLALSPEQIQKVEFAKQQGTISFSLRSQWDEELLELTPTTAFDVVGFKGQMRRGGYREYRGR